MRGAAAAQAVALVLVALAVARLARARWPLRAPTPALLLWQALGLAAVLLALEVAGTLALAPAGRTHAAALRALPTPVPWWSALAAAAFLGLLLPLAAVMCGATLRTLRARHRHRVLVDLVATRNPLLRGASVVDHDLPVAYCLPGLRPRVVLSRGVVTVLDEGELRAVLAHELAHVAARHDLVVLPFVAVRATLPWLPQVRCAAESVALLVEVLADDRASRRNNGRSLATALAKLAGGGVPVGGLAVTGPAGAVLVRTERLLDPPPALRPAAVAAVLSGAVAVLALPVLGVLLPLLW